MHIKYWNAELQESGHDDAQNNLKAILLGFNLTHCSNPSVRMRKELQEKSEATEAKGQLYKEGLL